MAFKTGDKVVCIKKGDWLNRSGLLPTNVTPYYGQEVVITNIKPNGYLHLKGFEKAYSPIQFRKVEPTKKSNSVTRALVQEFEKEELEIIEHDPKEIEVIR
jgi:hypothetical protein